jgi:hypothetical protein
VIKIELLNNLLGCDICYQSANSDRKILKYIAKSDVTNFMLYKCPKCGCYWEISETVRHVIDEKKAKECYTIKHNLNSYIKLIFVLIYIIIFYYAWAKFKLVGVLVTLVSYYIMVFDMYKK